MAWRVGMKCQCVDASGSLALVEGAVYTVLDIRLPFLCVDAYANQRPGGNSWYASRFRPLVDRKTDISFAHEILRTVTAPDPAFERAMAEAYPDRLPEYVGDRT